MTHATLRLLLVVIASVIISASPACGQVTTHGDDFLRPKAGDGHDYISSLAETVNPANGTLSINIPLATPKDRGFTLPLAVTYNSAQTHLFVDIPLQGHLVSVDGWGVSLPALSASLWSVDVPLTNYLTCSYISGYTFFDPMGEVHPLNLGGASTLPSNDNITNAQSCLSISAPPSGGSGFSFIPILTAGDKDYTATMLDNCNGLDITASNCDGGVPRVKLTDNQGTSYFFTHDNRAFPYRVPISGAIPGSGANSGIEGNLVYWPDYIEDRNGNITRYELSGDGGDGGPGTVAIKDDLGRNLFFNDRVNSPNSMQVGPLTYTTNTTAVKANYTEPRLNITDAQTAAVFGCAFTLDDTSNKSVLSSFKLPNTTEYSFTYDPIYGLPSKITYPDGAWVKYTWKMSGLSDVISASGFVLGSPGTSKIPVPQACIYRFASPVIDTRSVGAGSDSSTPSMVQTFTYETNWSVEIPREWISKKTTVTTRDNVIGKEYQTVYTYTGFTLPLGANATGSVAAEVPVEQTVVTSQWDAPTAAIQTISKTWFDQDNLASTTTTLDDNSQSKSTFCYTDTCDRGGQFVIERDDYDFGLATIAKKTLYTYPYLNGIPFSDPCKIVIKDGKNIAFAETDILFDGAATICGVVGSPKSVQAVAVLPPGTHDKDNYSANGVRPRGNKTAIVDKCLQQCVDKTTYLSYDETGQVISVTDSRSNTTTYDYADSPIGGNVGGSSNAYVTQITHPDTEKVSLVERFQYNYVSGQMSQYMDENSQTTSYSYTDPLLRIKDVYGPPSPQNNGVRPNTHIDYIDGVGGSVTTTDPVGVSRKNLHDGMGRVVQAQLVSDPQPIYTDTMYDGMGRVYSSTNPYRTGDAVASTIFDYDPLGRMTLQIQPDSATTTSIVNGASQSGYSSAQKWSYAGNQTTFTDETGRSWKRKFDVLGRLTNVSEPNGASTSYGYDPLNNLKTVTQPGVSGDATRTRSYNYDSLSRLLTSTNPETGTICYGTWNGPTSDSKNCVNGYDGNGNLLSKTDARGVTISYSYDALNRLVSKTYPAGSTTPSSCYSYDESTSPAGGTVPNPIGRLTTEWTQTGACASKRPSSYLTSRAILEYDPMGRIKKEQQCTPANCSAVTKYALNYTYDLAGNVTQGDNGIGSITWMPAYDAAGRLSTVTGMTAGGTHYPTQLFNATEYGPFGLTKWLMGGSSASDPALTFTRSYDNRMRVSGQQVMGIR